MLKRITALLLLVWGTLEVQGQTVLTLDSAIQMALEKNFDVQIAESNLKAMQLRDYRGNAGETPRPEFNVSDNAQLINVNQDLSNGTNISRNGAFANALGANLQVNWTVFNGMRVVSIKQGIREQIHQSEEVLRATLQNTVADVMRGYYGVVRQQYYLKVISQSIEVSRERKVLAEQKKAVGYANASDLLLADLDLYQLEQAFESQQLLLRQGIVDLITLTNAELGQAWLVEDTIVPLGNLNRDDVLAAIQSNPELAAAEAAIRASEQAEKTIYANRMPVVQLNGGLGYSLSNNNGGFIISNQSYGPFLGVNANVPLLQYKVFNRQHAIARQETETLRIMQLQAENALESAALKLWDSYETAMAQLQTASANVANARRYLDLVIERNKLDAATVLELREAQQSFEDANFRLIDLEYQAIVAEVELMRLAGMLAE